MMRKSVEMGRHWHRLRQSVIALAMALVFAGDGLGGWLEAFRGDEINCGMACCRRAKWCCCKKGARHETHEGRPALEAGAACLEGCRQKAAPPQGPPAVLEAGRSWVGAGEGVERVDGRSEAQGYGREAGYAQFGRPPPEFT